jgi:DNA-directed RNA polymerase subunit N (RpoN/RPB10)
LNKAVCIRCGKELMEKYEMFHTISKEGELTHQCMDCMVKEKQRIMVEGYREYFNRKGDRL